MSGQKIKILLTGPGHGRNISYSLSLLNNSECFETTFLTCNYSFSHDLYTRIKVVDYNHPNKLLRLFKLAWKVIFLPKQKILYMQDGLGYNFLILKYLLNYEKLVFFIWSEYIINALNKNDFNGVIARAHINSASYVLCSWYGTYNKLIDKLSSLMSRTFVFPEGLSSDFSKNEPIKSEFLKNFLLKIEADRHVFINMRSFSDYNAIEVLLEAVQMLKSRNFDVFSKILLIFWHGNNVLPEKREYISNFIRSKELSDSVWCIEHPYLQESDIKHLLLRSNVIINLVKHDQLSYSIYEAMYLKKEMLCSDIEPYRLLNQKYNAELMLTKIDVLSVADEMVRLVNDNKDVQKHADLLDHRKKIVEQYLFEPKNGKNIIEFLIGLS